LFSLSLLFDVFTALSAMEDGFFFSFFSFFSFFCFFFFFASNPSTVCTGGTLAAVVTSVSLPELKSSDCGTEGRACDNAGVTCTSFA
ncbi:hypothetical protein N310_10361, partial [Acanthisitta chloris]